MRATGERHIPRREHFGAWAAKLAIVVFLATLPVSGAEFEKGKVYGSWDTTITFGSSWRLEDPDTALTGLANGGSAFSVNGDDGNLNYDTGIFSLTPKLTSELELHFGPRYGLFVRGSTFYDSENEDGDRLRTKLSEGALDRVGSRTDLLDAYFWAKFDIGGQPAELRVGEQVISWGESTFIQNSINTINPIEVSAIRVPGAELREALLPEGAVFFSLGLSDNASMELFHLYRWNDTEIDPPGSYFSTNDFAGDGGEFVFLGFGDAGDIPPFSDPSAPDRPFLGVPRAAGIPADDGGQYGAAFRLLVPAWNATELGFYYINYHSRLPTINGRTGTVAGATTAGVIGAAATPIVTETLTQLGISLGDGTLTPAEVSAAIGAGAAVGVGSGAPVGASQGIAGATGLTFAEVFGTTSDPGAATSAGSAAGAATAPAFATDAYAQTARYFLRYPEDIQLYGLSFNASLGKSGVALQGEVSYRQDAPLQVDDVELLFAALAPLSPVFNGTSGIPGEPGASQLVNFLGQDYSTQFETEIPGYIERDVVQYQVTATKVFGPKFGADQSVLVSEVALTHVEDMPDKSVLRLEGPATYTSGNPYHEAANPGAAHVGKPADAGEHFADASSWGYRVAGRMDYFGAIGSVNLSTRFSWQHDVNGVSPGPGGNFIEDRKAITVGLSAGYQNTWEGGLSYTRYFGAGRHNLINDRDFIGANVKYSF